MNAQELELLICQYEEKIGKYNYLLKSGKLRGSRTEAQNAIIEWKCTIGRFKRQIELMGGI